MSKFKLLVVVLLIAGSSVACATTGRVAESQKSVSGISQTADHLTSAQAQVDKIVISIDNLLAKRDLPTSFKNYSKDVAGIQTARQKTKVLRAGMQAKNRSYMAKWQMEMDVMQDQDVKSALAKRKDDVKTSFDKIQSSLDELSETYQPFLTNIMEIRRALALDLNPAGIDSLQSTLSKAKEQADQVKVKIMKVREELDDVAKSMSPTTAVK